MAAQSLRDTLIDVSEPFLFLLVMMTYVNAMEERGLFLALRDQLLMTSVSVRAQYWLIGVTAFSIAPLIGELATAAVMTAMVLAMGGGDRRFVGVCCINVVVAANTGGVCSPFGDITTLIAWQRGAVELSPLLELSVPAFVAWLIPALIMSRTLPDSVVAIGREPVVLERGAMLVLFLYAVTLALAVGAQSWLHLPAVLGMMTGLGLLGVCAYGVRRGELLRKGAEDADFAATALDLDRVLREDTRARRAAFDVFAEIRRVDWDTLLYLYGAVLCIAGLAALGLAARGAEPVYGGVGPITAYARLGLAGAVDGVLVMLGALAIPAPAGGDAWLWQTLTIGYGRIAARRGLRGGAGRNAPGPRALQLHHSREMDLGDRARLRRGRGLLLADELTARRSSCGATPMRR